MIRRMSRSDYSRPVVRGLAKALAFLMCLAGANGSMASFAFAAAPQSDDPWWDYQIIMWQPHTPEQNAALKNLGITAGEVIAKRIDLPASSGPSAREQLIGDQASALIASNLPWYVDNLATDFYSPYHMLGSTAAFDETRRLYEKGPRRPCGVHAPAEPLGRSVAGANPQPSCHAGAGLQALSSAVLQSRRRTGNRGHFCVLGLRCLRRFARCNADLAARTISVARSTANGERILEAGTRCFPRRPNKRCAGQTAIFHPGRISRIG